MNIEDANSDYMDQSFVSSLGPSPTSFDILNPKVQRETYLLDDEIQVEDIDDEDEFQMR